MEKINTEWGFFGTLKQVKGHAYALRQYEIAERWLNKRIPIILTTKSLYDLCNLSDTIVYNSSKEFLNSRMGRHLADQYLSGSLSITKLLKKWFD